MLFYVVEKWTPIVLILNNILQLPCTRNQRNSLPCNLQGVDILKYNSTLTNIMETFSALYPKIN